MRALLAAFATHPVAANLLMIFIILGSVLSLGRLRVEVYPEFSSEIITIDVPYPGAAPAEVEEAVCMPIEEALEGLEGIRRLTSTASEGIGSVAVELRMDADVDRAADDIKVRVDAIDYLPPDAERPITGELLLRRQVISVVVYGPFDELTLTRQAERIREELVALPEISQAEHAIPREYELSVDVSEALLQKHRLTFDEVTEAIRRSSVDSAGGSVRAESGEVLLRTEGKADSEEDLAEIVLLSSANGARIELGDLAEIYETVSRPDAGLRFDGQPAAMVQVFRVGNQSASEIATAVKRHVDSLRARAPEGMQLAVWQDNTVELRQRLGTLATNGLQGLGLVFLLLAVFLRPALAFWVAVGTSVSFFGAVGLMPYFDLSLNSSSLFAFIMALGLLVDDAIVVGENIFRHQALGKSPTRAAIDGTIEISRPVTFSVLTTAVAFLPLTMIPGNVGKFLKVLPLIVICTLIVSLVESLLILPAHLSHVRDRDGARNPLIGKLSGLGSRAGQFLNDFAEGPYRRLLEVAVRWRFSTCLCCLMTLPLTFGLVAGGHLPFSLFPPIEGDNVVAYLSMQPGTSARKTRESLIEIERTAHRVIEELANEGHVSLVNHTMVSVGSQPFRIVQSRRDMATTLASATHLGEMNIELVPAEDRTIGAAEIVERVRKEVGAIPSAADLEWSAQSLAPSQAIDIQFIGEDFELLEEGIRRSREALALYPGVINISDTQESGKDQLQLRAKPQAEALGLSLREIGRQVRQAYYGEEAQRIQRSDGRLDVMVRYSLAERRDLASLDAMFVRGPDGIGIPLSQVATIEHQTSLTTIRRLNQERIVSVRADIDTKVATPNEILAGLIPSVLEPMQKELPGVRFQLAGDREVQAEVGAALSRNFMLSLFVIFALLAVLFGSYLQPAIVMTSIPLGVVGAFWGHALLGRHLTILSIWGIVAASGIVVNDSLVMVDRINRFSDLSLKEAILRGSVQRFRPILLTSLTTFAGLTPLLLETSKQAQHLIPMAISVAFGVLFSTTVVLFSVPAVYRILEDARTRLGGKSRFASSGFEDEGAATLPDDYGFEPSADDRLAFEDAAQPQMPVPTAPPLPPSEPTGPFLAEDSGNYDSAESPARTDNPGT